MPSDSGGIDLASALTFREVRSFLRRSHFLGAAAFFGLLYTLGSLLYGGMLVLTPLPAGTTIELLTGSGTGQGAWNYPGLLVVAPWGVLALPFFATFAMIVVAVGVGLGMAVAALLIYRLLRPSPEEVARTKAVGIATGLTPAMISLVTIGSCCTTTAAATGGVALIAQASGTTTANLLLNNWYLGVAQIAIVWSALFGQELLLAVYGGLLGLRDPGRRQRAPAAPSMTPSWWAGAALRTLLVVGGLLWSLSMFAEWTVHPPLQAGVGWWVRWLVQHQLVAAVAVGIAFFPRPAYRFVLAVRRRPWVPLGVLLGGAAASVLVWLPPPLPAWGLDSLTGELLGGLGAPATWGAIAPGPVGGTALALRWILEFVVPAGTILAALVAPDPVFRPLLATVAQPAEGPEFGPSPFLGPAAPGTAIEGRRPSPVSDLASRAAPSDPP